MDGGEKILTQYISGVYKARHSRSMKSRDAFIKAEIETLNGMRFEEIRICDLAHVNGNTVGSFYTRFKDKDAFFDTLRLHAVERTNRNPVSVFTAKTLRGRIRAKRWTDLWT